MESHFCECPNVRLGSPAIIDLDGNRQQQLSNFDVLRRVMPGPASIFTEYSVLLPVRLGFDQLCTSSADP
jgi:hypothetical protein